MTIRSSRRETLKLTGAGAIALSLSLAPQSASAANDPQSYGLGTEQAFDLGWRFQRGEVEGAERIDTADSTWRMLDLPHDFSIEDIPGNPTGPFEREAKSGTAMGFTRGGTGWYRKRFRLEALPSSAQVEITFEGVMVTSDVWINGHHLGSHYHGYTPFSYDLTPYLDRDGENVIAVRAVNEGHTSRWYAGSGIYRPVRLNVRPTPARIERYGIAASTRSISPEGAWIDLITRCNQTADGVSLRSSLRAPGGRTVAEVTSPAGAVTRQVLYVPSPDLWSPDAPHLYTLRSELVSGKSVFDAVEQPFGIRIVTMDAQTGLAVNGKRHLLRGGCIHHDNGLLGACAYEAADERRIALLKARGYNAIRSSHNPSSSSLRAACDRQGMFLIEEAFDAWDFGKEPQDYALHFRRDWETALRAMIGSARNSPSVIMWSIGNEIPNRNTPEGMEWCWKLANFARSLDPTRPVTAALNGLLGATVTPDDKTARAGRGGQPDEASSVFLDVAGYNYRLDDVEPDHAERPDRVIYGSETYPSNVVDYTRLAQKAPYFLGEFVWTAMDYLGEAGIARTSIVPAADKAWHPPQFPTVNAWCGDIDLIGNPKPQSLARDVAWGVSPVEVAVRKAIPQGMRESVTAWGWPDELPSWNWSVTNGEMLSVAVYSAGDRVELFLNGTKLAEKAVRADDKMKVLFDVPYAPGVLEAKAWRGSEAIGSRRLATTGTAIALEIAPEAKRVAARRNSLVYLPIRVVDAAGALVPDHAGPITVSVSGDAQLVGFGSANPQATGSLQSNATTAFRGHALAVLRASGPSGTVRLEASAPGLRDASALVRIG